MSDDLKTAKTALASLHQDMEAKPAGQAGWASAGVTYSEGTVARQHASAPSRWLPQARVTLARHTALMSAPGCRYADELPKGQANF